VIHVVCGEDAYSVHAAERRLVDSLVEPEWRSVNLTVYDGAAAGVADVVNAARTPSFFGNRLVVVRDCPWFTPAARKKGKDDEAAAEARPEADAGSTRPLVDLINEGLPGGCHLLLIVPKALNKTLSTTKALLAAAAKGAAEVKEFPGPNPFKPEPTIRWLVDHARETEHGIDAAAAELLVGRLGQDKYLLAAEVAKLASYAGDRPVRAADVALLSPPGESGVFDLLDAILARRLPEAITHLRRLTASDHPLKIVATMGTFLRTYLQMKLLKERGAGEDAIATAVKWHPFRVSKALAALRPWTSSQLGAALAGLAEAEQALKGSGLPDALVMERLLAKVASL